MKAELVLLLVPALNTIHQQAVLKYTSGKSKGMHLHRGCQVADEVYQ